MFPLNYKLRTKDIATLTLCSIRTADRLKSSMKKLYGVQVVRYKHYLDYFGEKELESNKAKGSRQKAVGSRQTAIKH